MTYIIQLRYVKYDAKPGILHNIQFYYIILKLTKSCIILAVQQNLLILVNMQRIWKKKRKETGG